MANPGKKAIVRGADGEVYIVSKTDTPVKMSKQQVDQINKILEDHRDELESILNNAISAAIPLGCGHKLNLTIPDVSME
jgi:hypothetical protein